MFGNPYAERRALEATYEDVATVIREQAERGDDNISRMEDVPVYTDIICALSKGGDRSSQTEAQHNLDWDMKLYAQPDKDIKPGDKVEVERFGRIASMQAHRQEFKVIGVPVRYVTHIEVPMKASDIT